MAALTALFSGAVGALLVFFLGWLREWWRDERARRGLLVLLRSEIEHNTEVIRAIEDRLRDNAPIEDLLGHPRFTAQKTATWDNVQERAAALLPDDIMAAVDGYYSPLEALLTLVRFPNMVSDSFDRGLRGQIKEMQPEKTVAATRQPYREQLEKLQEAQERAPEKLQDYLDRPFWGPLFLQVDRRLPERRRP